MIRPIPSSPRLLGVAVLSISTLLAACSAGSPGDSAAPSVAASATMSPSLEESALASTAASPTPLDTATPAPEPTDSLGAFACNAPVSGVGSTARAQITDVRVGTHDGYDRIVFEFTGGIPAFTVEPATPPLMADPSGLPISVNGSAFLQIGLNGGTKVSPEGVSTYGGPTTFAPGFDELIHLVEGGDFEAVSTWYAGLRTEPCIRVLTLSDTPRLVIDIQH